MAITINLSSTGYGIADLFDLIDFVATDSVITSFTPHRYEGEGEFRGQAAQFAVEGDGWFFVPFASEIVDDNVTVVSGRGDRMTVLAEGELLNFSRFYLNHDALSIAAQAEKENPGSLALETFLMSVPWRVRLGDDADVIGKGSLVGDGATFNLRSRDIIEAGGGDDIVYTGNGKDVLYGDEGNDFLHGGVNRDRVYGGTGDDFIKGGSGSDLLVGGSGNDTIIGGKGWDRLYSGSGDAVLRGGPDADQFFFKDSAGDCVIEDFNPSIRSELISLREVTDIENYDDLVANHMEQIGTDVVITAGESLRITLLNVDMGDLGITEFNF